MRPGSDAKRNWIYCNSSGTFIREIKFKQPGQSSRQRMWARISRPFLECPSGDAPFKIHSKTRGKRTARFLAPLLASLAYPGLHHSPKQGRPASASAAHQRSYPSRDVIQDKLDQTHRLPKLGEQATLRFSHRRSRGADRAEETPGVRCTGIFRPRHQQLPIWRLRSSSARTRERSFADRENRESERAG